MNTRSQSRDPNSSPEKSPSPVKLPQNLIKGRKSINQQNPAMSTHLYPSLPDSEPTMTPPRRFDRSTRSQESPGAETWKTPGPRTPGGNRRRDTDSPFGDQYDESTNEEPTDDSWENSNAQSSRTKTPAPKPMPKSIYKESKKPEKSTNLMLIIAAVIIAILAIIVAVKMFQKPKPQQSHHNFDCPQLTQLSSEFPHQPQRLFKHLRSGVESFQEGETSVFSFFSTDETIMRDLMKRIVELTHACLHCQHNPVRLGANDISRQKVDDYRTRLNQSSIMVIDNLHKAPIAEVPVLHSVCDTENPLVKPSVIFISMRVPSAPGSGVKVQEFIYNYLDSLWSSLTENVRYPLIARIIDQTFFVDPKKS